MQAVFAVLIPLRRVLILYNGLRNLGSGRSRRRCADHCGANRRSGYAGGDGQHSSSGNVLGACHESSPRAHSRRQRRGRTSVPNFPRNVASRVGSDQAAGPASPNIDSMGEAARASCMKDGNFIGPVTRRPGRACEGSDAARTMCNFYSITTDQAVIIARSSEELLAEQGVTKPLVANETAPI